MKRLFTLLLTTTMTMFTAIVVNAQSIKVNPKFGSVSKEELELSTYPQDTSASALMLYKRYDVEIMFNVHDGGFVQEVNVRERIKILKESGKSYADYSKLYFYTKDLKEEYKNIKVETYNLADGKIEKTKMSKKFKFDEKFSEQRRKVSFTAENVKVGSVIEVEYTFSTPAYTHVDDIVLQAGIPINQIETSFSYPEYFTFNKTQRATEPIGYKQETETKTANFAYGNLPYTAFTDHFFAVDVPALSDESYCYNPSQYRSRVIYDLRGIVIPGSMTRTFNARWPDIDKQFVSAGVLKECFGKFPDKEGLAQAIEGIENEEEKIAAIRRFIVGKVKWNDDSGNMPASIKDTYKKGSGDVSDINALMASALNSSGFLAEPVFLRRRSSGILVIIQVASNAFDTMILRITSKESGKQWFFDAVRNDGYLNVLPANYLVTEARIIRENETGEWLDITASSRSKLTQMVSGSIDANGLFTGKNNVSAIGNDSYAIKNHYHDAKSEEEYLEEIQNDEGLEEISNFKIDLSYSGSTSLEYDFEKEYGKSGDLIYISPFISRYHEETAFRKETRKVPVDMPYPTDISYVCAIDIPEGWHVEEVPQPVNMNCPPVNGKILFTCQNTQNKIILRYRFSMADMRIPVEKYADLRAFWEQAVGIEKSVVVLKKD